MGTQVNMVTALVTNMCRTAYQQPMKWWTNSAEDSYSPGANSEEPSKNSVGHTMDSGASIVAPPPCYPSRMMDAH